MRVKFTKDWVNPVDGKVLNKAGSISHFPKSTAEILAYEYRIADIVEEVPGTEMSQIDHLEHEQELNRRNGITPGDKRYKRYEYPSFTY